MTMAILLGSMVQAGDWTDISKAQDRRVIAPPPDSLAQPWNSKGEIDPFDPFTILAPIARYDDAGRMGSGSGAYQIGFFGLEKLGYIEPGQPFPGFGQGKWQGVRWTGKDGITSRDVWMISPAVQDQAFFDILQRLAQ